MTDHERWREQEKARVGGKTQREAEAVLDKQQAEPFVEVCNDKHGEVAKYRRNVADVLTSRGDCSPRRNYFYVNVEFDEEGNIVR